MARDVRQFVTIGELMKQPRKITKPPAYPWQQLALEVIERLRVPDFKRSAIFKVCQQFPETTIRQALIDTQELCENGNRWQYFFKILNNYHKNNNKF